jgi:nucleoside-diphosphate-sugar epimerase
MGFTLEHCVMDYEVFKGKTDHYIFISTAMVYKKPHTTFPVTEEYGFGNPWSEYATNKIASEEYLNSVHGDDFPVTIVRPSHTFCHTWIPNPFYGSGDYTMAARMEAGRPVILHDSGQSLWTLTATSDFAVALVGLLENEAALGESFHITSDEPLTWNCIYQEIGQALGCEPNIIHIPTAFLEEQDPELRGGLTGDKSNHAIFDNSKIKRFVLGFQCRKPFQDAIRETIAWYREDPTRQKINPDTEAKVERIIQAFQQSK